MPPTIFVVNPGSTSTKIALFHGDHRQFDANLTHERSELNAFPCIIDQLEYRFHAITRATADARIDICAVDVYIGRGGLLKPLQSGTYAVNDRMLEDLQNMRYGSHACNLGAIIAHRLSVEYGKPAYIANPPVVDELMDEARYTGIPDIRRTCVFHALNHKAVAYLAAEQLGLDYNHANFIVAHMGGGVTVGAHLQGRVVDVNNALKEGPFSPERAGNIPTGQLVELCFSGRYTKNEMKKLLVGHGGIFAYTNSTDMKSLVARADQEKDIDELLNAMIYRISREICACSAALCGQIDCVILTGGLAHSELIISNIKKRVSFLAPVLVFPGEDEMAALAASAKRVLDGTETCLTY